MPQLKPSVVQSPGVQPQTFETPPPPHQLGGLQRPQLIDEPQPSWTAPQFLPSCWQVAATQGPASAPGVPASEPASLPTTPPSLPGEPASLPTPPPSLPGEPPSFPAPPPSALCEPPSFPV